jgi:5'-nucleotidase
VSGAQEAALWGVAGIALSISVVDEAQYRGAARFLSAHLEQLVDLHGQQAVFLNINFPAVPIEKIKGVRVTRQGCAMFGDNYVKREDPRGREYYWIYGDKPREKFEDDSDDRALLEGYIAVTPLAVDTTNDATRDLLTRKMKWNGGIK